MKILRIVSSGFREGGAETGIMHIHDVLEKRGHEIRILAGDARPDLPHFNDYTFRSPRGFFGRLMYSFNFSAYRALKKALQEFDPDVVHLHTLGSASPSVLFALSGYPTVATVHGPEGYTKDLIIWNLPKTDFKDSTHNFRGLTLVGKLRYLYYRFINYPLYRLGFRNVDRIVTISSYIYNLMKTQGMESIYIPNGVKLFDYVPLTTETISHRIVFAGRLEKFKGVEYVLKALPQVVAQFSDTQLYIAGTGRDEKDLRRLAKSLNLLNHVVFLGHVSGREALQNLFASSAVMVVPSIWPEVSSRSGIEAISVGRPVIASHVGGLTDWLIPGKTGYLVPPGDAEAITSALLDLFAHPETNISMGINARKKAEEYDIELHANRIEEVYRDVIENRKHIHGNGQ